MLNTLLPVALTNVCAVVLLDIPTFTVIVVAPTAVIVSAVLLAGSGHCDGSEVSEAALAFTMLEKYQIEYKSFSLSKEIKVVNHSIGKEINDYRNAQVESSRIARGFVDDLKFNLRLKI